MKFVAILVVLTGVVCSQLIDVPAGALLGVRNAGIQTISAKVQAYNQRLIDAVEAFKPINTTCNNLLNTAIPRCRSCVVSKCEARAKSVCRPEKWQVVLGKTVGFFKDGIPNFFTSTIPDIFVNKIGGGIVDVGKDIGGFFKDTIGGGITDFGEGIAGIGEGAFDGVIDFGNTIGEGVVNVGKTIGKGFGKAIGGIKDVGNKIKDFGSSIGKAFGSIFGKRESGSLDKLLRSRRQSEPSCGDFENDPENACKIYLQSQYCSDCGFDSNRVCPGYKAATDEIKAANAERSWLTGIQKQKQNYDITKLSFNPTAISSNGGFRNVVVSVNLFGKNLQFTLNTPINPYLANIAGPIIAERALQEFKKA